MCGMRGFSFAQTPTGAARGLAGLSGAQRDRARHRITLHGMTALWSVVHFILARLRIVRVSWSTRFVSFVSSAVAGRPSSSPVGLKRVSSSGYRICRIWFLCYRTCFRRSECWRLTPNPAADLPRTRLNRPFGHGDKAAIETGFTVGIGAGSSVGTLQLELLGTRDGLLPFKGP